MHWIIIFMIFHFEYMFLSNSDVISFSLFWIAHHSYKVLPYFLFLPFFSNFYYCSLSLYFGLFSLSAFIAITETNKLVHNRKEKKIERLKLFAKCCAWIFVAAFCFQPVSSFLFHYFLSIFIVCRRSTILFCSLFFFVSVLPFPFWFLFIALSLTILFFFCCLLFSFSCLNAILLLGSFLLAKHNVFQYMVDIQVSKRWHSQKKKKTKNQNKKNK